jgi:predicted enzyme related to lactoylglutathione lyase
MPNPFVHVELMTTNVKQAKDFYGAMFDWKLEEMTGGPTGVYTMIQVGEGVGGGIMAQPMPGAGTMWIPYVLVDDAKAATAKARSLKAKIYRDVTEVPNRGMFSIIADPSGGMLGLWQTTRAQR